MPSNIKDTLTTICSVVIIVGGAILSMGVAGVTLPAWLTAGATAVVAIATALTSALTGKNADGTTKSAAQLVKQADPAPKA